MLTHDTSLAKCYAVDVMAAMADPIVVYYGRSVDFVVRGLKIAVATVSA